MDELGLENIGALSVIILKAVMMGAGARYLCYMLVSHYQIWRGFCPYTPKGGWGYLMAHSCLESQGCHLISLSYLLSCFFSV